MTLLKILVVLAVMAIAGFLLHVARRPDLFRLEMTVPLDWPDLSQLLEERSKKLAKQDYSTLTSYSERETAVVRISDQEVAITTAVKPEDNDGLRVVLLAAAVADRGFLGFTIGVDARGFGINPSGEVWQLSREQLDEEASNAPVPAELLSTQ